jgi:hypothetical protein
MDRPGLTTKQAEALRDRIRPMLHFLHRCRRRLDTLGFDSRGPIYQVIDKAYCAMHDLHMKLHYESCGRGVGRASHERPGLDPAPESSSTTDHGETGPSG